MLAKSAHFPSQQSGSEGWRAIVTEQLDGSQRLVFFLRYLPVSHLYNALKELVPYAPFAGRQYTTLTATTRMLR